MKVSSSCPVPPGWARSHRALRSSSETRSRRSSRRWAVTRDAPSSRAASWTAGMPLPRTSPMISRVPEAVRTAAYRSPPIWASASASAARYREAVRSGPSRRGSGGRTTRWAASETYRTCSSSFARRSRRTQKTTRLTPTRTRAMIWASWLAEKSSAGSRTTAMTVWAITARAATAPTVRGPPNDGVSAGAATSSGPRWMWGGARTSTTVTATIHTTGTTTSARPSRPGRRPPSTGCDMPPLYTAPVRSAPAATGVRGNPPQG